MTAARTAATLAVVLTRRELEAWDRLEHARKELALAQAEIDLRIHWSLRRYNVERAEQKLREAERDFWTASL